MKATIRVMSSAVPVDHPLEEKPGEARPLKVADMIDRKFATTWRGYDPAEVDVHVRELYARIEQLQHAEARQRERAELAERRADPIAQHDEHRLIELLGEEMTRVLEAARQAASDIRRKAEEAASRLISDANEEARKRRLEGEADILGQRARMLAEVDDLRQQAAGELEKRRGEADEMVAEMRRQAQAACDDLRQQAERDVAAAEDEAEALRDTGRDDAHRMVGEAKTLREQTLRDLARRRRTAREQLERLNAARERLLAAYDVVRRTVDEATTELKIALPEAKAAGDAAMRRVREEREPTVDELESQVTMAKMVGLLGGDARGEAQDEDRSVPATGSEIGFPRQAIRVDHAEDRDTERPATAEAGSDDERPILEPEPPAVEPALVEPEPPTLEPEHPALEPEPPTVEPEPPAQEPDPVLVEPEPAAEELEPAEEEADPTAVEPGVAESRVGEPTIDGQPPPEGNGASRVDELFARLKANGTQAPGADAPELVGEAQAETETGSGFEGIGGQPSTDADERLLRQRDETLEPLERALGRRIKRVLADEQNEVLDLVRRTRSSSLDELLPGAEAHADRFADAAVDELQAAAFWGAAAVGGHPGASSDALADELGRAMTTPLRERVTRSLEEMDGDLDELTERLRALYREWKGQHVGDLVHHYVAAAYAHGAFDAVPEDGPVRWVVDRSSPVCPDADDNALAGPVAKGEAFPTGQCCAPAHPGCRCMTVPVAADGGRESQARSAPAVADR
jgi:cell division septum initiation protein DivIVA